MELVLDMHSHTIASGHAYSTILEYVAEAKSKELELIAITDHAPAMPCTVGESYFMNFCVIPKEIDGLKIMMGAELSILNMNGDVDLPVSILKKISPVIASVHPPCYSFQKSEMSMEEKAMEITETFLNVMDNPYVKILGHPGDPRYPFDIGKIVRKSVETHTLLEINNSSLEPTNFRYGSKNILIDLLKECKKLNCPVVVGSDAHFARDIGNFECTKQLLSEADFPYELVANTSVEYFFKLLNAKEV